MGTPRDVFLLGAGFSRAISPSMPLMGDLGPAALSALKSSARYAFEVAAFDAVLRGNFEEALTALAEDQPGNTDAENLANIISTYPQNPGETPEEREGRVKGDLARSLALGSFSSSDGVTYTRNAPSTITAATRWSSWGTTL